MIHYIADEMAEVLHLDIRCDFSQPCEDYVLQVFDWVADYLYLTGR